MRKIRNMPRIRIAGIRPKAEDILAELHLNYEFLRLI